MFYIRVGYRLNHELSERMSLQSLASFAINMVLEQSDTMPALRFAPQLWPFSIYKWVCYLIDRVFHVFTAFSLVEFTPFLWFFHVFPRVMVFPWFSCGFPILFTMFPRFSYGFHHVPMVFPWFSNGFLMVWILPPLALRVNCRAGFRADPRDLYETPRRSGGRSFFGQAAGKGEDPGDQSTKQSPFFMGKLVNMI